MAWNTSVVSLGQLSQPVPSSPLAGSLGTGTQNREGCGTVRALFGKSWDAAVLPHCRGHRSNTWHHTGWYEVSRSTPAEPVPLAD